MKYDDWGVPQEPSLHMVPKYQGLELIDGDHVWYADDCMTLVWGKTVVTFNKEEAERLHQALEIFLRGG